MLEKLNKINLHKVYRNMILFLIFFTLGYLFKFNLDNIMNGEVYSEESYIINTAFIIILYILISTSIKMFSKSKNMKEVNDYYIELRNNLKLNFINSNKAEKNDPTDVLELMSINMKEIKDYYVLSKTMAQNSFKLSVSMCILGFILIVFSIIMLLVSNKGVSYAIIPAVGGSVVEVIAGTSLFVYKKSLDQLNKYYEALHDNERFLSVVNIVNKISVDKRDDTYIEIIKSQLRKDT